MASIKKGISPGLLKSTSFWIMARVFTASVFVWMISVTWGRWSIPGVGTSNPLMYTNAGNTLFWVVWLMGLVILIPLTGRAWCGVCPVGYLNELVSRWGLARPFPRRLRNLYFMALFLFITVLLLGLWRIHHFPGATAIYLTGWAVIAVFLGLIFKDRSLCSHICPIGGMLGLYSRLSFLGLEVADQDTCRDCDDRECIQGVHWWGRIGLGRLQWAQRFRRHPCPTGLKVWEMKGAQRCLMCFNCMRVCPHDNIKLGCRTPLTALWQKGHPRFSETAVVAALLGFLMLSFLRFWPGLQEIVAAGPSTLSGLVGTGTMKFIYLGWAGFILPLLLVVSPAVLVRSMGMVSKADKEIEPAGSDASGRFSFRFWIEPSVVYNNSEQDDNGEKILYRESSIKGLTASFLPILAPILLGGHIVLALVKLNAKLPYFFLGLNDPAGIRTFMAVEELGLINRPEMIFPISVAKWVSVLVLSWAIFLSLTAARKLSGNEKLPFLPFAMQIILIGAIFAGGLQKWLF